MKNSLTKILCIVIIVLACGTAVSSVQAKEIAAPIAKTNKTLSGSLSFVFPSLKASINDRIEVLYDREHTIGHAFFMKLTDDSTITDLASVFKRNILPLLEEYFFEDWEKICHVLGKSGIYEVKTHRSLNFFKVRKIVAEYFHLPPWKHQYT